MKKLLFPFAALFAGTVSGSTPVAIGDRLELFVDHHLIERLDNVRLELGTPVERENLLRFDEPWEGPTSGAYVTVLQDGDRYRMYYRGGRHDATGKREKDTEVTCYAESRDGIRWEKPRLGLHAFAGSTANNIVYPAEARRIAHNFAAFVDHRPGVPASERYKAVGGGERKLYRLVSADGVNWRDFAPEPIFDGYALDTMNVPLWSPAEQVYAIYLRTSTGGGTPEKPKFSGVRTISRSVSKDFVTWSKPEPMSFGDTPPEHLYTNATQPYFRAPHILIALPLRFVPDRQVVSQAEMEAWGVDRNQRNAAGDAVLLTSRGGTVYDRTFMESFMRPGLDPKRWTARNNFPALGVVPTGADEMSLYVCSHYTLPDYHLRRYTLRTDGFASARAGAAGGVLETKLLTFTGHSLVLNCSTSAAGGIRLELLDADGRPFPGFDVAASETIVGDSIARTVRWKKNPSLAALAGRPVKLRFHLKDADLYSFRFAPEL